MTDHRWLVLCLAPVRSPWSQQVTGWATSGVVAMDLVKCLSPEEVRARLASGRRHSAIIVDAATVGVDRELLGLAEQADTAAFVVSPPRTPIAWSELGARVVLQPDFSLSELIDALRTSAAPISTSLLEESPGRATEPPSGHVIAVIGRTGSGVSTTAIACAQAMAQRQPRGRVLLADLDRRADLALLHDAPDIVPGLQELVEHHRHGSLSGQQVRSMTFPVPTRGYDLLLGLRQSRDWPSLTSRSFDAALESLRRAYRVVVADCHDDLEGHEHGGSLDVEERNLVARTTTTAADLVLALGTGSLVGLRGLVNLIDNLLEREIEPVRIQPVIRSDARRSRRRELDRALADLVSGPGSAGIPSPLHLPDRPAVEDAHHNGTPLPASIVHCLSSVLHSALRQAPHGRESLPTPVLPGSLGTLGVDPPTAEPS